MSSLTGLRFLRPYLYHEILPVKRAAYARIFSTYYCLRDQSPKLLTCETKEELLANKEKVKYEGLNPTAMRIHKLRQAGVLKYPRFEKVGNIASVKSFLETCEALPIGGSNESNIITLHGRVQSVRKFGASLVFVGLIEDGYEIQLEAESKTISRGEDVNVPPPISFKELSKVLQRGDIIYATGYPVHKENALGTLKLTQIPQILTPGVAPLPKKLGDAETRIRNRHLDLLVHSKVAATIRLRSQIIQHIRDFLLKDDFIEVQTPILADKASGAMAQPFKTNATEFPEKELTLRIAPELWLKRLVIGGLDRVFEIGPAFRNEGLDAIHNPEFTTCEFYKAYANLEDLISMTEELISGLIQLVHSVRQHTKGARHSPWIGYQKFDEKMYQRPFQRLEFIPAIETALFEKLPDLRSSNALEEITGLFTKHKFKIPENPTLPRLLDKLASICLESQFTSPTFITHHPSCMSPLSKSFLDPNTQQHVSARAELFIGHREIANMYEEENSPFEQRKKFNQQLKYKHTENPIDKVDEGYIDALKVGLPPTGGWGCGIDRLVMWLSESQRISDVLPFGNLRNVVNLGAGLKRVEGKGESEDSWWGADLEIIDILTKFDSIKQKEEKGEQAEDEEFDNF